MANFKTCHNGHNYDSEQHEKCPYCPVNIEDIDYKQTLSEFKNTLAMTGTNELEKTVMDDEMADAAEHPFKKTQIIVDGKIGNILSQPGEKRKLFGWLVRFSDDQWDDDFRIYEGRNKIGSAVGCEIVIDNPSVSSEHATIFCREKEFLIKDNFSTNGTAINGVVISEGTLMDGDELKFGNALFKFKSIF